MSFIAGKQRSLVIAEAAVTKMPGKCSLQNIPREAAIQILARVEPADLLAIAEVCRSFAELLSSPEIGAQYYGLALTAETYSSFPVPAASRSALLTLAGTRGFAHVPDTGYDSTENMIRFATKGAITGATIRTRQGTRIEQHECVHGCNAVRFVYPSRQSLLEFACKLPVLPPLGLEVNLRNKVTACGTSAAPEAAFHMEIGALHENEDFTSPLMHSTSNIAISAKNTANGVPASWAETYWTIGPKTLYEIGKHFVVRLMRMPFTSAELSLCSISIRPVTTSLLARVRSHSHFHPADPEQN